MHTLNRRRREYYYEQVEIIVSHPPMHTICSTSWPNQRLDEPSGGTGDRTIQRYKMANGGIEMEWVHVDPIPTT